MGTLTTPVSGSRPSLTVLSLHPRSPLLINPRTRISNKPALETRLYPSNDSHPSPPPPFPVSPSPSSACFGERVGESWKAVRLTSVANWTEAQPVRWPSNYQRKGWKSGGHEPGINRSIWGWCRSRLRPSYATARFPWIEFVVEISNNVNRKGNNFLPFAIYKIRAWIEKSGSYFLSSSSNQNNIRSRESFDLWWVSLRSNPYCFLRE